MTTHWIPEQLLEPGVGVILDTETTDLDGRIIEISIIDAATGTVLMDQLINPQGAPICAEARTVHPISPDDLATAPTFTQVRPRLEDVVADRVVMAWNAPFDRERIEAEYALAGLDAPAWPWCCLMRLEASVMGCQWRRLDGPHRGLGDVIAARRRLIALQEMRVARMTSEGQ